MRDRNDVAVPLAEGVVDLVDQRGERAVRVIAEEDAERIEAVAERARHAEQADPPASEIDTRLPRAGVRPARVAAWRCRRHDRVSCRLKRLRRLWENQRSPLIKSSEFVEIEQQPERAIAETGAVAGAAAGASPTPT